MIRRKLKQVKTWWKWRKYPSYKWPYRFIGEAPKHWKIEYGTPLRPMRYGKTTRWETPDGLIRAIGKYMIEER